MPAIAGARALYQAQAQFRADAIELYRGAADRIGGLVALSAGPDGRVPRAREGDVVRDAGEVLLRLFVGADGRSAFDRDGVTALAPYGQALNHAITQACAGVVNAHARWLRRNVPEDVRAWLAAPAPRPLRELRPEDVFAPDPLAQYEAPHAWVDPNGYRLSDRVWRAGVRSRERLDALLAEQVRAGAGSLDIARQVERFLLPNRAPLRTMKPYGRDASFDGMRLARTEIAAAHGRAALAAARANPYVTSMAWRLSASHPKQDICDDYAASGPYPLGDVPSYPPHPQCLCVLVPQVTATPAQVTAELRVLMDAGELPPYFTPADANGFLRLLLGEALFGLVVAQIT